MGVEAGEKYCKGEVAWEEVRRADWHSEASAFLFDFNDETDPGVALYVAQVKQKRDKYERLLVPSSSYDQQTVRELLRDAAYFANFALKYPDIRFGKNSRRNMENYGKFMPLELFEVMVSGKAD